MVFSYTMVPHHGKSTAYKYRPAIPCYTMARGIPWYMVYYGVLCNTFNILNLIYKAHNVGEKFAESEANVKRTTPKYHNIP